LNILLDILAVLFVMAVLLGGSIVVGWAIHCLAGDD